MSTILYIVLYVVSTAGQPLGVSVNSTMFVTDTACAVALEAFEYNVTPTAQTPAIAYCVPAVDIASAPIVPPFIAPPAPVVVPAPVAIADCLAGFYHPPGRPDVCILGAAK